MGHRPVTYPVVSAREDLGREPAVRETVIGSQIEDFRENRPAGRSRINFEQTMARFPAGTLEAIRSIDDGRSQAEFIRDAVLRELDRREAADKLHFSEPER